MADKVVHCGPMQLPTSVGNLINCALAATNGAINVPVTQPYLVIRHVRVVNTTSSPISFSMWKGASLGNAAGTEVVATTYAVGANDAFDWWGIMRLDATDFLTGLASAAGLTMSAEGQIAFS